MRTQYLIGVLAVMSALAVPCYAGYAEGEAAYKRGDFATAMKEFVPLARQGNAEAEYFIGAFHFKGYGVPENKTEAVKWFRLAADQGYAPAQFALGWAYENGGGGYRKILWRQRSGTVPLQTKVMYWRSV